MLLRIIALSFLLGLISPLKASNNEMQDEIWRWFNKFHMAIQEEVELCDKQVLSQQPNIDKRLKPLFNALSFLGTEKDPSVKIIADALTLFKISLKAYYQPPVEGLDPQLSEIYQRVTKTRFKSDVEFTAGFLKIVTQMIVYEGEEKYAEYFEDNIAANNISLMTLCKERIDKYYPEYFTYAMVYGDDHKAVQFLKALYKTHKKYGLLMQSHLKTSWEAHKLVLPRACPHHIGALVPHLAKVQAAFQNNSLEDKGWKRNLMTEALKLRIDLLLAVKPEGFVLDETPHGEPRASGKITLVPASSQLKPSVEEEISKDTLSPSSASAQSLISNTVSISGEQGPLENSALPLKEGAAIKEKEVKAEVKQEEIQPLDTTSVLNSIEFFHTLESPVSQPLPSSSTEGVKQHTTHPHKRKQAAPKKERASKGQQSPKENHTVDKSSPERASFTLRKTMSEGAISDFMVALDVLSEEAKNSLPKRIKKDIAILKSSKLKLKQAYKVMLRVTNHIGKLEWDRGKGSHAMITIFRDGEEKQPSKPSEK